MDRADAPPLTDTIVARATPAGRGGVAVVRISGPATRDIAVAMTGELPAARRATLAGFLDADREALDLGLALFFPAPHSFTGEDVLELHAHGGPVLVDLLVERVLGLGARLARPGEFTERAFLNDKLDLTQAEAIADLIDAGSRTAARAAQRSLRGDFSEAVLRLNEQVTELRTWVEAAIDFPDEDVDFLSSEELEARIAGVADGFAALERAARTGQLLRDGLHVVIAGRPNAGKSSLLNALAGYAAAIVTPVPGTTRDLVREHLEIDGLPLHVVDTAGLREATDVVEEEGVRRARAELATADHALVVVEAGAPGAAGREAEAATVAALLAELPPGLAHTVVRNKVDLTGETAGQVAGDALGGGATAGGAGARVSTPAAHAATVNVSALTGAGLDALRARLRAVAGYQPDGEGLITARRRHLEALADARRHFDAACTELRERQAGELMAEELLQVQNALAGITGEFTSDDLLGRIFAGFCIGK